MTKHLRFLFVMLLAMIWSAGWAQTTVDFSKGLPTGWSKTGTVANLTYQTKNCIQLQQNSTITSPAFEEAYSSMKISMTRSNPATFTISYQVGSASAVELKTFSNDDVAKKSWKDYIVDIPAAAQVANCKFIFKSSASSYFISTIEFTSAGPTKISTTISFGSNSNKTFTFTEGKLEGFSAPTATETNNVEGTIKYSSNNESAVKVDASTGALSFPGYGEATITATFTPTDADTYAGSTDSYKVVNKADLGDFVFYESFDKCDGKGGNDGTFKGTTSNSVVSENKGWIFSNESGANKCIKLGSKSNGGSATTPAINLSGKGILTFKIASWEGAGSKVTISVENGSLSYNGKNATSFAVSPTDKEWNDINMTISATGAVKIKFSSIAKNRFFLDEVMVKEITTPAVETLTLKESDTNTLEAKTGVNVTLKRSMVANEWNTICLPFDVPAEQATAVFGDNVKIAALDKNSTGTTLSFNSVKAITASVPYLIKPSIASPADGYNFKGVTIKDDGKGKVVAPKPVMTEGLFGLVGIYNKVDVNEDIKNTLFSGDCYAAFLGDGNKIYKAGTGKTKGFRAYFAIPKSASASALRVVIDGTATSIKNIDSEVVESNAPVYNLQGQRVDGNNLTPGIYVKAGKKFVVK